MAPARPSSAQQIRTGTQLVIVDVVVQDAAGKSVRNLPREAFHVTESKQPQTLTAFEEHSSTNAPKPGPAMPPMPPGVFTDYTPTPPGSALNVLLIDALNTPIPDQAYLRSQLKEYVNKAQPGTQVAIIGFNRNLYWLQGFTSDPNTLKDAVNHKLIPRASSLMDDPMSGMSDTSMSDTAADAGLTEIATNLQQTEALTQSYQLQLRIQYTLDAFNALAHYLSTFPGRKNLLWFSGSFPINILPDASLQNPFSVLQTNEDEFRETTSLLARAQVAVYPIDARGLMTPPALSAANSDSQMVRNPAAYGAAISKFNDSQAQEHMTMEALASDTGGHAYYNTNGLAAAVSAALDTGANYYTLAYTPTERDPHGEFRTIHVDIAGPQVPAGLKLAYRHGYYADDQHHAAQAKQSTAAKSRPPGAASAASASAPDPAVQAAQIYRRAAMAHGAPTPQDILFKVRVLPVSTGTEAELAPGETPDPAGVMKGPYRRYSVDFAALGSNLHLDPQPDGNYTGSVEFSGYVYNGDGKLLNLSARTVALNLKPVDYKRLMSSGINLHLLVSTPARGEWYLRLALRDVPANHFGVVEISTASVSRLAPPLPAPPAPPAGAPK